MDIFNQRRWCKHWTTSSSTWNLPWGIVFVFPYSRLTASKLDSAPIIIGLSIPANGDLADGSGANMQAPPQSKILALNGLKLTIININKHVRSNPFPHDIEYPLGNLCDMY